MTTDPIHSSSYDPMLHFKISEPNPVKEDLVISLWRSKIVDVLAIDDDIRDSKDSATYP